MFDYDAVEDIGLTSAAWEVIGDFLAGADNLNLSTIDANADTARRNEAFSFIGNAKFTTNSPREPRFVYIASNDTGYLYGNVDADATSSPGC